MVTSSTKHGVGWAAAALVVAAFWVPGRADAAGARQTATPTLVPFVGTATLTYLGLASLIPARAQNDLARYRQTTSFGVRDADHYRIDTQVQSPPLESGNQTIAADGTSVVRYDTVSGRAVQLTQGTFTPVGVLSLYLMSRYAPIGSTTDQVVAASRLPHTSVRRLGQATVAGRTADVLDISPIGEISQGCGSPGCKPKVTYYGVGRWWIDHEHGVVLRYQQRNIPKKLQGQRAYRYEVTSITFGQGPSDADLAYSPPVPVQSMPSGNSSFSSGGGGGRTATLPAPPG